MATCLASAGPIPLGAKAGNRSSSELSREYAEKVLLQSRGFQKRKIVCVFEIPVRFPLGARQTKKSPH